MGEAVLVLGEGWPSPFCPDDREREPLTCAARSVRNSLPRGSAKVWGVPVTAVRAPMLSGTWSEALLWMPQSCGGAGSHHRGLSSLLLFFLPMLFHRLLRTQIGRDGESEPVPVQPWSRMGVSPEAWLGHLGFPRWQDIQRTAW